VEVACLLPPFLSQHLYGHVSVLLGGRGHIPWNVPESRAGVGILAWRELATNLVLLLRRPAFPLLVLVPSLNSLLFTG